MTEKYGAYATAALLDGLGTLVGSIAAEPGKVLARTRGMR
jgi:hypothetical protein